MQKFKEKSSNIEIYVARDNFLMEENPSTLCRIKEDKLFRWHYRSLVKFPSLSYFLFPDAFFGDMNFNVAWNKKH